MTDDYGDDGDGDAALPAAFAQRRDERAFEAFVRRYVDVVVYAAARRQLPPKPRRGSTGWTATRTRRGSSRPSRWSWGRSCSSPA
jgi:hypothetical protein